MEAKEKTLEYAQKIKALFVNKAVNGELYSVDFNMLNTSEIESILRPVFDALSTVYMDAQMAIDGTWDCTTDEGIEGFEEQIQMIDKL